MLRLNVSFVAVTSLAVCAVFAAISVGSGFKAVSVARLYHQLVS